MATASAHQPPRSTGGGGTGGSGGGGGGPATTKPQPPKSASAQYLSQIDRTLSRRLAQLKKLDVEELTAVHDLVLEEIGFAPGGGSSSSSSSSSGGGGAGAARSRSRSGPAVLCLPYPPTTAAAATTSSSSSAANNIDGLTPSQLRTNVEHTLTVHFYRSVDRTATSPDRTAALGVVKKILAAVDVGRTRRAKRRLREAEEEERERTREKEQRERESSSDGAQAAPAATGATGTAAASGGGATPPAEEQAGEKETSTETAAAAAAAAATTAETETATATAAVQSSEGGDKQSSEKDGASSSSKEKDKMGLSLSAHIDRNVESVAPKPTADDDEDSDDEIIILDGPPPPPMNKKGTEKKQRSKQAAAAAVKLPPDDERVSSKQQQQKKKKARYRNTTAVPVRPHTVSVQPDTYTPTYSASLHPRPGCRVTYDSGTNPKTGSKLDEVSLDDFNSRLDRWDPYWDVLHDFTACKEGGHEWGIRTSTTIKYEEIGRRTGAMAKAEKYSLFSAASHVFQLDGKKRDRAGIPEDKLRGIVWGKAKKNPRVYETGEVRCIVRMLPLYRTDKDRAKDRKKRADAHLWPRGTFVQLNGRPVSVTQRKQQSHAPAEWKGICHPLDLTAVLKNGVVGRDNALDVCTRDECPYGIQVAICEYVGPDELFNRLATPDGRQSIEVLSYEDGLQTALRHVEGQMVVLDESDHDDEGVGGGGGNGDQETVLTLSLLCPISKTPMVTPVRGKKCRHVQCFDLKTWLHSNATVSGGRWRCGVCEDFVSTSDLVVDGMFGRMLERHAGDVSGSRDRVQLRPDGTWSLMDENRLRYQNRKRSSGDAEDGGGVGQASKKSRLDGGNGGGGGPPPPEEVIDIE